MDVPAGVTQGEGHTGFLIHLPSAVLALLFLARRIQPFLSLVDREVEFCRLVGHLFYFILFFGEEKSQSPGFELKSQRVRRFRDYELNHQGDRLMCTAYLPHID